jgi:transposase
LLTDGAGVPLGLTVDGANRHDKKLVGRTLNNLACPRPAPKKHRRQHMCMDKGYDYPDVRELIAKWGYTAHIVARGQERDALANVPGYRARRWVVERTHSWFNRFRRLLIRWEKNVANYTAMLHLACAYITLRAAGVMG